MTNDAAESCVDVWTVQHHDAAHRMATQAVTRADWAYVEPAWRPAYEWMVQHMAGITGRSTGTPPVWVWPEPYERRPDRVAGPDQVRMLASDRQIADGLSILLLRVPERLLVLSSYAQWCDLLLESPFPAEVRLAMTPVGAGDMLQGCLPEIRSRWVQRVVAYDPDG